MIREIFNVLVLNNTPNQSYNTLPWMYLLPLVLVAYRSRVGSGDDATRYERVAVLQSRGKVYALDLKIIGCTMFGVYDRIDLQGFMFVVRARLYPYRSIAYSVRTRARRVNRRKLRRGRYHG